MSPLRASRLFPWFFVAALAGPPNTNAAGWQAIGPEGASVGGFAQARSNPDRIYCLSGLGVLRSDDRGDTWTCVDPGGYTGIAVSSQSEDLLLVGKLSQQRLHRSTDGGATWADVPIDVGQYAQLSAIAFDPIVPDRVLAAVRSGTHPGIHRSSDGGLTWVVSNTGFAVIDPWAVAFHPQAPGVALVGNGDGIYRTTDGGASWAKLSTPSATYVVSISFCAGSPTRVWAIGDPGGVLRSDDGGLSFAPTARQPYIGSDRAQVPILAAHPTDANIVVGGAIQAYCSWGCYSRAYGAVRSTDGGVTWPAVSYPFWEDFENSGVACVSFDLAAPSTVYMATTTASDTGLLRSQDTGASWSSWVNGLYGQPIFALARGAGGAVYVRRNGGRGLWSTPAVGGAWTKLSSPQILHYSPLSFEASRRIVGLLQEGGGPGGSDVIQPSYSRSTDGGSTWMNQWLTSGSLYARACLVVSNHGIGGITYLWVDDFWTLYRTNDGLTFQSYAAFPTRAAIVSPFDPLRLFAVHESNGGVQLSTNGGATWAPRSSGLPTAEPVALFMDPAAPARLAVVYRTAGAFRSDDAGVTWAPMSFGVGPMTIVAADWDPAQDRFALATQGQGVFLSGHGFVTTGLPAVGLTSILFVPESNRLLVGTASRSVWALDLSDPTASPVPASTPRGLEILAHPNPSRGEIVLDLAAPSGRTVAELAVFDVAGQRVVTLATGIAGGGTFTWNGRNAAGERVAPGVYFARVTAGSESRSRRLVLLDR
ncbi:MAG: FlgD immunoglobulin-like domain containing protein [bacterium]